MVFIYFIKKSALSFGSQNQLDDLDTNRINHEKVKSASNPKKLVSKDTSYTHTH